MVSVVSGEALLEVACVAGVMEEGLDTAGFGEESWISGEDRQETWQEVAGLRGIEFEAQPFGMLAEDQEVQLEDNSATVAVAAAVRLGAKVGRYHIWIPDYFVSAVVIARKVCHIGL